MQRTDSWRTARPVALLAICALGVLLTLFANDPRSLGETQAPGVAVEGIAATPGPVDHTAYAEE